MTRLPASIRTLSLAAILALVGACSPATGDLGSVASPPPTPAASLDLPSPEPTGGGTPSPGATVEPGPTASGAETTTIRAYFFLGSFTRPAGLVPVLREIPKTVAVGTAAVNALLEGPSESELAASPALYTTIPSDTTFLDLIVNDGVATVNLSREFAAGGGSASAVGRLAQVVYTLTQFPTVDTVVFELDGESVTVFSGEGIVLDHPVGRADYTDQLPAIWVDRPAWGAAAGNPSRVTGLANVFEATFGIAIDNGPPNNRLPRILADVQAMASCGTGCWGTFDVTIPYSVSAAHWGTLRVYDLSARDGTPENVTDYPVWLTPPG